MLKLKLDLNLNLNSGSQLSRMLYQSYLVPVLSLAGCYLLMQVRWGDQTQYPMIVVASLSAVPQSCRTPLPNQYLDCMLLAVYTHTLTWYWNRCSNKFKYVQVMFGMLKCDEVRQCISRSSTTVVSVGDQAPPGRPRAVSPHGVQLSGCSAGSFSWLKKRVEQCYVKTG